MFQVCLDPSNGLPETGNAYREGMILKKMPEMKLIKRAGNLFFLYSPLSLKIYILAKDEYEKFSSLKIAGADEEKFFKGGLLIPEKSNPYPSTNTESILPVLSFTSKCNLGCIYCFSRGGEKNTFNSLNKITSFIDFFKKRFEIPSKRKITLFSTGEPTMAFPLIKKVLSYLSSTFNENIEIELITNGTFPEKVTDWIVKHNIKLQISCDGPASLQNLQRPMRRKKNISSHLLHKTLEDLQSKKYCDYLVHPVVTKLSLNRMEEMFNYFYSLGVPRIMFTDVFEYGRASHGKLSMNTGEFAKKFLQVMELANEFGMTVISNILPLKKGIRFCDAGNILFMTEKGDVVTCFHAVGSDDVSKAFKIGEYFKSNHRIRIDEKKRGFIASRTAETIDRCKKCFFKWNCGAHCAFSAFARHGTILSPGSRCTHTKYAFRNFLDYKIKKEFYRIRPALEIINDELHLSMILNSFKLHVSLNENDIRPNSFIKITRNTDLRNLLNNIVNTRDSCGYNTCIFLLSFDLHEKSPDGKFTHKIVKFLKEIKRNKILFIITTPVCRNILGKDYGWALREFRIPKNWFDSLELFTLKDGHASLKNGKYVKISRNSRRFDLYAKLNENANSEPLPDACKYCTHRIRKTCLM